MRSFFSLDQQRQQRAREYARVRYRFFFANLALSCLFLLVFLFSGLSAGLRDLLSFPQPATVTLYLAILSLSYAIILAPLAFYRGFTLPHRYGLCHQTLRSWLADAAKGGLLGLVLGVGIVVVIYQFLVAWPTTWWLLASALMLLITVVLATLAPIMIVPLFFKLEPLGDLGLRQRLLGLAERTGAKISDVFVMNLSSKSRAGNAMVIGMGNTRRIVLSDTLLERYTPAEIEAIMAHELGHHRHRDITKLIAVQAALTLLGFYLVNLVLNWAGSHLGFSGSADIAAFPLMALTLGACALLLAPISNAYSRYLEAAADNYAIAVTADPNSFTSMLTKLTDQNLSEAKPSRWVELLFYDHPPYYRRVEQVQHKVRCDEAYPG